MGQFEKIGPFFLSTLINMKFKLIIGKNFKKFVGIYDITTKEDLELYDVIVDDVLHRTEFNPFVQGLNKKISYSYLQDKYFFPYQFWSDVKSAITPLIKSGIEPILEDEELLYADGRSIMREDFDDWLATLKFPEKYNTVDEHYAFQRDSVFLAINAKLGRIEVSMSGGKTFITYLYCRYLIEHGFVPEDMQILVIVPSTTLAKQLKDDFLEYDTFMKRKVSVESIYAGAKKLFNADVVCGTYQSLSLYETEYFDGFCACICDELHRAKSWSIRNNIYAKMYHCEYFFGMTGTTPKYKTLDYLHIVSMFGPALVIKKAHEIIASGVATPIKIKVLNISYNDFNGYSQKLIDQGILGIEKYNTEKRFFQNNYDRTKIAAKLLKHHSGSSLILVDTVAYCSILKDFMVEYFKDDPTWNFEIIHGKTNGRDEIIYDFKNNDSGKQCIIATYGTMSTGVSINNLEYIYFMDGGKSENRIRQSLGRGMRIHPLKEFCVVYDFVDNIPRCSFKSHGKERMKIYKQEQFPFTVIEVTI